MKKSKKNSSKSKLSLDDLKKKGTVHNETLEAISGGVLGAGTGGGNDARTVVDGDKKPK
jgi:hypothetical protein